MVFIYCLQISCIRKKILQRSFYRNLADNIDIGSDFYLRITADANIPREDVQKFILATSDFGTNAQNLLMLISTI